MTRALLVVDVQFDFLPGGALPVPGGSIVARRLIQLDVAPYSTVVATRDWHPADLAGPHFTDWPRHCVQDTHGANLAHRVRYDELVSKGMTAAAYSAFDGATRDGTALDHYLLARGITAVDVVGLAYDHCVKATAIDAARLGYHTSVLQHYTAAVAGVTAARATADLLTAGVVLA